MKVTITSWPDGRGKRKWTDYVVGVEDIPISGDDDVEYLSVLGTGPSKAKAEIFAEVFQHYIDTFPGAEDRIRQAANALSDAGFPLDEVNRFVVEDRARHSVRRQTK